MEALRALVAPSDAELQGWLAVGAMWLSREAGGIPTALADVEALLAAELPDELQFHLRLSALRSVPDPERAEELATEARHLSADLGPRWSCRVDVEMAAREPYPPDPADVLAVVARVRGFDDPLMLEQALKAAGSQLLSAERSEEAATAFAEGLTVIETLPTRLRRPHCGVNLAVARRNMGQLEEAAEALEDALASMGNADAFLQGIAHVQLGRVRYCQGALEAALASARQGESALRRVGNRHFASAGAQDAGAALCDLGRPSAAVHAYLRALTYFVDGDSAHWGPGLTSVFLARALTLADDLDQAIERLDPWTASPIEVVRAPAYGMRAILHALRGEEREATQAFAEALSASEPASARAVDILFRLPAAAWAFRSGDMETATSQLGACRRRYRAIHHRMGLDACERFEAHIHGAPAPVAAASSFSELTEAVLHSPDPRCAS